MRKVNQEKTKTEEYDNFLDCNENQELILFMKESILEKNPLAQKILQKQWCKFYSPMYTPMHAYLINTSMIPDSTNTFANFWYPL